MVNINRPNNQMELSTETAHSFDTMRLTIRAVKVARHTDKVFSARELVESLRFWVKKMAQNALSKIEGRGEDLYQSDVHYNSLLRMMDDVSPDLDLDKNSKSNEDNQVFDYYWFKLDVDPKEGIIRKS